MTDVYGLEGYAARRYHTDPVFHAKAYRAAQVIWDRYPGLDESVRRLVLEAATLGLAAEWLDPSTGEVLDR